MLPLLRQLCNPLKPATGGNGGLLQHVVVLRHGSEQLERGLISYESLFQPNDSISDAQLQEAESLVSPDDVCSLQFTSGTTGSPKVAMLTHSGLINNAIGSGLRMKITQDDILCCTVPLFHCFGLVLGVLMSLVYGSSLSLPSENFSTPRALQAITDEKCTLIYGVPTMYNAYIQELHKHPPGTYDLSSVRVAVTGGATSPSKLFRDMRDVLGIPHIIHALGMTECSPVTFLTTVDDTFEIASTTAGKVMPHVTAKVVDMNGKTVPIGRRGELFIAGYNRFRGYWQNPEKTNEVFQRDKNGTLWFRTGDEVTIDAQGYCRVTGRIKDIIIRGGENVYPTEIEERIVQHPSVSQASVVGVKDSYHGELVAAFVQQDPEFKETLPSTEELSTWVGKTLSRHKVPTYFWWIGDDGVCPTLPQTASGKVQKMVLRDIALRLTRQ
ncbi:hypothetical protein LTR84_005172 [Exophiala bonariae]|uniref:AMP-dependent synthetase/ligase domain-containing protein n=1 Tax=Exophiala bonariae TaxID=1690606 RepID=A0AAV9NP12_9EURO|nr:hypothetical protein LTR84_005172 [Exophiala bonariae]